MQTGGCVLSDTVRLENWQKMVAGTTLAHGRLLNDRLRMTSVKEMEADRLLEDMMEQNFFHPV